MKLVIKKGLDIPLVGAPSGPLRPLPHPELLALNVSTFEERTSLLVKVGERVRIGQPLLENRAVSGHYFVSPAGGRLQEIRRGAGRRPLALVIEVDAEEEYEERPPSKGASREALFALFLRAGLSPHLRMRPFDQPFYPDRVPRAIFIRALETLPFLPPAELQLEGGERYVEAGIDALRTMTSGSVHLVYREGSSAAPFFESLVGIEKHTIRGPHPAGSASVHIHYLAPLSGAQDLVWTLSLVDLLTIGQMVEEGRYRVTRVISKAGEGFAGGERGFYQGRLGLPVSLLMASQEGEKSSSLPSRLISGDPLTGRAVGLNDFLGFSHTALTLLPEKTARRWFSFLRPSLHKYTATRTDSSHLVAPSRKGWSFTTSQNGERRPFIDGAIYDRVMPLPIPTMFLVKALLCEDFELAEKLGIFEVVGEDFALAAFLCPSKIEIASLVSEGIRNYVEAMG